MTGSVQVSDRYQEVTLAVCTEYRWRLKAADVSVSLTNDCFFKGIN